MISHTDGTAAEVRLQETEYCLQLNRWFLRPIGAWPDSASGRVASTILNLICYALIGFTVIPCALYIVFEAPDLHLQLKALGPMGHWVMGGLNYSTLLLRSKEIRRCVEHIDADWRSITRPKDREVMLQNARFGRYIATFCAVCMHGGVFSYSIISGSTPVLVREGNQTWTVHALPCPVYKGLLDANISPMNEIVLAAQFVSCFIVNSVTVGACSLAVVFTTHALGQLNVLMLWLDEYVCGEKEISTMAGIVEHHLRALSFISYIENIMHQICFVELLGASLDICMLGYYSITEWDDHDVKNLLTYCVIFISMSFNIFIFCYIGEILTEECKKVGETIYMTRWYDLHHKTALDLNLIISRSSVVIKITAGKLVQLSVSTFGDVMKTCLAYVNMLRTMSMAP